MPRICLILIAGLDQALLTRTQSQNLPTLSSLPHHAPYQPAFPAVTSTTQATLTTGTSPDHHGIICNGLYTFHNPQLQSHLDLSNHRHARTSVSFWEQSNSLLQSPRFWSPRPHPTVNPNLIPTPNLNPPHPPKVAMLFCQNSMPSPTGTHPAADIVLTPKPTHTPNGKTLTACWSNPADLYPTLTAQLGPFPLHNYWSPMAGLPSSQWIVKAAQHVWTHHRPDLQLVYIPHLDFNLQRLGPNHPAILKDLADIDALLAPLAAQVRADGATLILAGDYGMSEVSTPIAPNLALRRAGLLQTRPDDAGGGGKLLVDYAHSPAFVMADHQVAFLYTQSDAATARALEVLKQLSGIDTDQIENQKSKIKNINNPRAGAALLLAKPDAFFIHDWWESDAEKPTWQFTVDIHNKPGYDPRELFFDPVKKCIAQNPALVKGSHGRTDNPAQFPVLLSDAPLPPDLSATAIAPWLARLLAS